MTEKEKEKFANLLIYCAYPEKVTVQKAGYTTEEHFLAALKNSPHLRPCTLYRGWVEKKGCLRCQHFIRSEERKST